MITDFFLTEKKNKRNSKNLSSTLLYSFFIFTYIFLFLLTNNHPSIVNASSARVNGFRFKSFASKVKSSVSKAANKVKSSVKSSVNKVKSSVRSSVNKVAAKARNVERKVKSHAKKSLNSIKKHVNKIKKAVKNHVKDIKSKAGKKLRSVKTHVKIVKNHVKNHVNKIKKAVKSKVSKIKNKVKQVKNKTVKKVKNLKNKLKNKITKSKQKIKNFVKNTKNKLKKTAKKLKSKLTEIKKKTHNKLKSLKKGIHNKFKKIKNKVKKIKDKIKNKVKNVKDKVKNKVKKIKDKVKNKIKETKNKIKNKIKVKWNEIKKKVNEKFGERQQVNRKMSVTKKDIEIAGKFSEDAYADKKDTKVLGSLSDDYKLVMNYNNDKKKVYSKAYFNPDDKTLVISFRGTVKTSIKDWSHNLDLGKKKVYFNGKYIGKVHSGFYKEYMLVRDDLQKLLKEYNGDASKIIITGHSQGAALAELAALDYSLSNKDAKSKVQLISFGQPRVGDKTHAELVDKEINDYARVVSSYKGGQDIVTTVPPTLFGFKQAGVEIDVSCSAKGSIKCHDMGGYLEDMKKGN
ncbi:hypothetical protein ABK040_013443 [Willaertia magna]